jgi:bifunctional enzyme CysN/CysC
MTTEIQSREQMNIVIVGHVDHGKSTVIGRLLADTHSLPEGKLQAVKAQCKQNARPFEYAFLLDALKDEQAQGITIDSARCFFHSDKREYIVIDAPGHIEFLKNMISGAARAEAAVLVIDAKEGVQENSRRHGYMMSMLGVRQLAVCINKMDLVDYSEDVYESIKAEYGTFLDQIGITPRAFIPVSAREGDNIATLSPKMSWYKGFNILEMLDDFEKEAPAVNKPLRFPVQDIYKFTANDDDRRIVAGRIETGFAEVGDDVVFLPSGKTSTIASIEAFNCPTKKLVSAGESVGFTLSAQIYIRPGELMCKIGQPLPRTSSKLRVNIFWLSAKPMIMTKRYKMKLANSQSQVKLTSLHNILDASDLTTTENKTQIERHDVADCTLQSLRPVACDHAVDLPATGRFVIIDNYEIVGGGVIIDAEEVVNTLIQDHVKKREQAWVRTSITSAKRSSKFNQKSATVLISGDEGQGKMELAKELEAYLFKAGRMVYYLGISNSLNSIGADIKADQRDDYLQRLGELSHLFTDAGMIFITTVSHLDDYEYEIINTLAQPSDVILINIGENTFNKVKADLNIDKIDVEAMQQINDLLQKKDYIFDYQV